MTGISQEPATRSNLVPHQLRLLFIPTKPIGDGALHLLSCRLAPPSHYVAALTNDATATLGVTYYLGDDVRILRLPQDSTGSRFAPGARSTAR